MRSRGREEVTRSLLAIRLGRRGASLRFGRRILGESKRMLEQYRRRQRIDVTSTVFGPSAELTDSAERDRSRVPFVDEQHRETRT